MRSLLVFTALAACSRTLDVPASSDGASVAHVTGVTVLAGEPSALGSIALQSTGALHGKVSLPGAASRAGAVVFIPGRSESALSGDDGSWRDTWLFNVDPTNGGL